MKKLTNIDFIKKAKEIHGEKYDYSLVNYLNAHSKVNIVCRDHGIFIQKPNSHLNGCGCPNCSGNKRMTITLFIEKSKVIHDDKYEYSFVNYGGYQKKVEILCKKHGMFLQTPFSHLIRKTGCPKCVESKGERKIREIMESKGIFFESEKRFEGCRDKYPLYFDFFIPSKNLLIEYDGRQHYESINFFGGNESFKLLKNRDEIKNKYALKHNIRLIRISYKEYDQIEKIINKIL